MINSKKYQTQDSFILFLFLYLEFQYDKIV